MTRADLQTLRDLIDLADEAITSRETQPDEDDTEEMSARHRETVEAGERLYSLLKADL